MDTVPVIAEPVTVPNWIQKATPIPDNFATFAKRAATDAMNLATMSNATTIKTRRLVIKEQYKSTIEK